MRKFHYAWIIVLVSGILMFGMSAQQMSQGVFLGPVAESLGVGMGTISLAYSTSTFCMLVMTPLAARLYHKYPTKRLAYIAVVDQAASLFLLSMADNVVYIVLGCLLECFSISSFLNVMPSVLIKRWFKDRGQFAYNIILFISMLGGVLFTPIANQIIEISNWRMAYRALAAYILVVELPVVFFLLKESPAKVSLTAYEDPNAERNNTIRNRPSMNADVTSKSAWKNGYFYLVCLFCVTITYASTMQNHLVKHLTSLGFSSTLGSTVLTAGLIGGLAGRVVLSVLGEKFSMKVTNALYCGMGIITAMLLCNAASLSTTLIILVSFFFGAAVKISTVQTTLIRYKVFGASDDYMIIVANMSVCTNIITATSGTVFGLIYDITGSYTGGFMLSIATFIASIALVFVILRNEKFQGKLVKNRQIS